MARHELQRVVTGAGVIGQHVRAERIGILKEVDWPVQSLHLVGGGEVTHLAGLD